MRDQVTSLLPSASCAVPVEGVCFSQQGIVAWGFVCRNCGWELFAETGLALLEIDGAPHAFLAPVQRAPSLRGTAV
eukprot:1152982-Pelagomonas_calceolata.AAC.7